MLKKLRSKFCSEKIVIETDIVERMDMFLKRSSKLNWGQIQQVLKKKTIRLKSQALTTSYNKHILRKGDEVIIPQELYKEYFIERFQKKTKNNCEEFFLNSSLLEHMIIERNKDFVVLNKPCGLISQGSSNIQDNLFLNMRNYLKSENISENLHLVHRLDKPVSGVMLMALNKQFAQEISLEIKNRSIKKIYTAILEGIPEEFLGCQNHNEIEYFIHFDKSSQKASYVTNRINNTIKPTKTHLKIKKIFCLRRDGQLKFTFNSENSDLEKALKLKKEDFLFYTEVEFTLISGKRHQLRVLSKDILKCPILFDFQYQSNLANSNLAQIIHQHFLNKNFAFSKHSFLQEFYQNTYKHRNYIYLHSRSLLLNYHRNENQNPTIAQNLTLLPDNTEINKKSTFNLEYCAQYPPHFKLFYSLFDEQ